MMEYVFIKLPVQTINLSVHFRKTWIDNIINEHNSAKDDAIAAPAIPILK